ncbi:MAG: hypothetical protein IKS03_03390 [Ruminococcus sp.]|nr:hypothetical protein [Ruminococcus sp.]
MSEDVNITSRESPCITIGDIDFYCDRMKASAVNIFYEQPTVSGDTVISNEYTKATKLIFSGRISGEQQFLTMAAFNNMMKSQESFDITYMGIVISDCRLQSFEFSDKGLDYAEITVTLITYSDMEEEE